VVVPVRKGSDMKYLSSGSVEIKETDLLEPEDVNDLLKGVDVVYHLASIRGSGWSLDDKEVNKVNVGITRNLLKASVAEGIEHYVYISSVSIYGHPSGTLIGEEYPCSPVTRYGRTKYESERLVEEYYIKEKLPTSIIRPVITYGPRDTWGMIPKLNTLINSKRYLTVGNGNNRVHLIYIDDLIEGLMLVMKNKNAWGKIFNLAGEEPVTINKLVRIISSILNKKIHSLHIPVWFAWITGYLLETSFSFLSVDKEPFVTLDKIDIMCRDRTFNIRKAKRDLGFSPEINYERGLKKTVNWLKSVNLI
jgi:dihydroflavonol-4-reductase